MTVEIDHLGIAVESLDDGLAFYRDLIGLPLVAQEIIPDEKVKIAMLPVGDASEPPRIELLEATEENSPIGQFIRKRGPGLHHVALRVDDLAATAQRLAARGCQLLNEPRFGAGGHLYIFVHPRSAGGVLLELIQK